MTPLVALAILVYMLPPLADLFDQFVARHAVYVPGETPYPPLKWGFVLWGRRESGVRYFPRGKPQRIVTWDEMEIGTIRFFILRTPFLWWGTAYLDYGHEQRDCWHEIHYVYREGRGWFEWHEPILEDNPWP